MLEVGRVVDAGGEHGDLGRLLVRQRAQALGELIRIVVHGVDDVFLEQLGKHPLHHFAVLEHVGDAGRHPQIVFEHVEASVGVADQVGAADVGPYPVGRVDAHAFGPELLGFLDVFPRQDAVVEDLLVVVDVVDEAVECIHALLETGGHLIPLPLHDQPGNDVEGPLAVDGPAAFAGVDGESDAHGPDGQFGRGLALGDLLVGKLAEHPAEIPRAG